MKKNILMRATQLITEKQIKSYQQNGAVCIRQALNEEEINCLQQGIDVNLQSLSPRAKVASQADDTGLFVEDFCNWQSNKHYKKFIFESPIAACAGLLMQSSKVRLYHDHLLVKEPHTAQRTPWHQDQPYYNIEGTQNCSLWIAVDPVPKESTLEFIAGSHLGPWLMPRAFMDLQAKWFPEGSLCEIPDIEAHRKEFPIISWDVQPGDVVFFHMLTLHAAGAVKGNQRRRVFSVRFLGDDIRFAPRAWKTSPEFPNLEKDLRPGMPMDHSLFPIILSVDE